MSIDTGHRYEDAACAYLESRDLRCIARKVPYRFGDGEMEWLRNAFDARL